MSAKLLIEHHLEFVSLKGTATRMIAMFYMKYFNKPQILIPVSSKLVENVEVVGV